MEGEREFRRTAASLAIICVSVGSAAACASTTPYNPDGLPPAQMSRIGEICHRIMGLPAALDTHHQACQESLSHSLAARPGVSAAALDTRLPAQPAKSYFAASNDEIHRREQQACAAIGEDPATMSFARCVTDLAGKLFDADNPHWRE
jgi:hypothetical protein